MTKFVKCVNNNGVEDYITSGKKYEVLDEYDIGHTFQIVNDNGRKEWYKQHRFEVIEEQKETKTFKFIPDSEIQHAIVDGVKGILIEV